MFEHGGQLGAAVRRYGIARARWLDLSTGINPAGYPVRPVAPEAWLRLPEDDDGLREAAAACYGVPDPAAVLPCAGSQAAIAALPALLARACPTPRVCLLWPGFAGHARAWAPYKPRLVSADRFDTALDRADIAVLAHPNNPTGHRFAPACLLDWHARLARRGGWLVVDEAFIDPTPADSLAALAGTPGLVILRSLGKFFGLAGARVGFVLGPPPLLQALVPLFGPWPLAGPARSVARSALTDRRWQAHARSALAGHSAGLAARLHAAGLAPAGGTALFQWVRHPQAAHLHAALARRGILTRLFAAPASLRLGLPGGETALNRLTDALADLRHDFPH